MSTEQVQRAEQAEAERDADNAELDQAVGRLQDFIAERDAAVKDAERFVYWYHHYLTLGIPQGTTEGQWRAAIDAAIKGSAT